RLKKNSMLNRAKPETLFFPNPDPPKPGETIEVRPGVFWARFPLPFRPDHVGLAGWLCERFGLQLAMSEAEYLIALNIRLDPQGLRSEPYRGFYRSHGLTEESTE